MAQQECQVHLTCMTSLDLCDSEASIFSYSRNVLQKAMQFGNMVLVFAELSTGPPGGWVGSQSLDNLAPLVTNIVACFC